MKFYKYNATGNDFIALDNRDKKLNPENKDYWLKLCARRTGIGADGVLFIEDGADKDFTMRYLNADGAEVSMCGNGARAISHLFAHLNNHKAHKYIFATQKGTYESEVDGDFVWVKMVEKYDENLIDVKHFFDDSLGCSYLNTGVPHVIYQVADVVKIDVYKVGREIRNKDEFSEGVNVNFFAKENDGYKVRTYERGVEDETMSCGTGITACAHYLWDSGIEESDEIKFYSRAGELKVKRINNEIYFGGKVEKIYEGLLC